MLRLTAVLVAAGAAHASAAQQQNVLPLIAAGRWRDGYSHNDGAGDAATPGDADAALPPGPPPTGTLQQDGPSVDVWAAVETLHRCGHIDVPDIPARAFNDKAGLTHMIVGARARASTCRSSERSL